MQSNLIDHKTLTECLDYNPKTGVFVWKERPRNHFDSYFAMRAVNGKYAGKKAQTKSSRNHGHYLRVNIYGIPYYCHRLAWFYVNKEWPEKEIDHINGVKSDNRIKNLRKVGRSENAKNGRVSGRNKSGCLGVIWDPGRKKWRAYIAHCGKHYTLGRFNCKKDAIERRKFAERELGFHPNHGAKQV